MLKFLIVPLLMLTAFIHSISPAELLEQQLPYGGNNYLKNRIPFLQQGANNIQEVPENNFYSISFENSFENYSAFTSMTGLNLPSTDFVASWYVFDRPGDIPSSITEMLNMVNQRKPNYYNQLVRINDSWKGQAELPYKTLNPNTYVFVYISIISRQGILVPVGSQSFYRDPIESIYHKEQSVSLNLDLVRFWYDRGYFTFKAAG